MTYTTYLSEWDGICTVVKYTIDNKDIILEEVYIDFPDGSHVNILENMTMEQYDQLYNIIKNYWKTK